MVLPYKVGPRTERSVSLSELRSRKDSDVPIKQRRFKKALINFRAKHF